MAIIYRGLHWRHYLRGGHLHQLPNNFSGSWYPSNRSKEHIHVRSVLITGSQSNRNYFKTYFVWDLISVVPVDLLFWEVWKHSVCRLNRIVRLIHFEVCHLLPFHIWFLQQYFDNWEFHTRFLHAVQLLKLVILLVLFDQWLACTWMGLAQEVVKCSPYPHNKEGYWWEWRALHVVSPLPICAHLQREIHVSSGIVVTYWVQLLHIHCYKVYCWCWWRTTWSGKETRKVSAISMLIDA